MFLLVRHRFPNIYYPRTYIGTIPEQDRTPYRNRSNRDWLRTMRTVSDKFTLYHQSLDSYLYLRFLRTCIFICVIGCIITWPILIPINVRGGGEGTELNRLLIGNVNNKKLLYAHAIIAWFLFGFVMFTIARERIWLIGLRQAWHSSERNARRLSSRTVLFLSAPTASLDEGNLSTFFGKEALRAWPVTKADKLQALVSSRNGDVEHLESAELEFMYNLEKSSKQHSEQDRRAYVTPSNLPHGVKCAARPRRRTGPNPFSKKVDYISWCQERIQTKEEQIERLRQANDSSYSHGGAAAVFVLFSSQAAAQRACQQVASSDILSLTPRYTGVTPKEVLWKNLTLSPSQRLSQRGIAIVLVVSTIILWSIPVSFVGAVSNISYLAENYDWLSFLNKLPDPMISLLSGLLPPLLLSLLASYVPDIFRCKCALGHLSITEINMNRHIQVFRRSDQHICRAQGSQMVLCLPGPASLLDHDHFFWCCDCSFPNCEGSSLNPTIARR